MQENSPCVCPVCNKTFIRKELMKDHLRRKHKMYKENYKDLVPKRRRKGAEDQEEEEDDYDEDLDVKPEIHMEEESDNDPIDPSSENN